MRRMELNNHFYGTVEVDEETFNKIDRKYRIPPISDNTLYLCANKPEEEHLRSLGIEKGGVVCDWFCIVKGGDKNYDEESG